MTSRLSKTWNISLRVATIGAWVFAVGSLLTLVDIAWIRWPGTNSESHIMSVTVNGQDHVGLGLHYVGIPGTILVLAEALVVYWSSEFETPRISRHCLTAVAISGPGVQFRPSARSMVPYFEDEGALPPARRSPPICAKPWSRSPAQFNDGQMFPAFRVADDKSELGTASSLDLGLWRRA